MADKPVGRWHDFVPDDHAPDWCNAWVWRTGMQSRCGRPRAAHEAQPEQTHGHCGCPDDEAELAGHAHCSRCGIAIDPDVTHECPPGFAGPKQGSDRLSEMAEQLHEARYSEIRAALEALVRECADAVLAAYPCSCGEAYTSRKLTAPDCFRCVALEAGRDVVLSRFGLE